MTAAQALWKLMQDEAYELSVIGEERNRMFSRGVTNRELEALDMVARQSKRLRSEFDANQYLLQALDK